MEYYRISTIHAHVTEYKLQCAFFVITYAKNKNKKCMTTIVYHKYTFINLRLLYVTTNSLQSFPYT